MTFFQAITLGIVQGLTEFLPVSSSGHLILFPQLFGWSDQGITFDVIVHLGTLVAVVVYFRKKLWELGKAFFSRNTLLQSERRIAWLILLSIIPAGIVGVLLETNDRSAMVLGISMIVWGIVLGIADWYNKRKVKALEPLTDLLHLKVRHVVAIACAQAVALIPGTSRSGITMTAGLFSGLDKKSAAEFSFLMSVPIIVLAGLSKVLDVVQNGAGDVQSSMLLVGFLASAASGFFAIAGLMKIIQKWSLMPFVVYRVVLGIVILSLLS